MLKNDARRRLWLLVALTLVLTTVAGTPLSSSSDAAPAAVPYRQGMVFIPEGGTLEPRGHVFGWMAAAAVSPTDSDHVYLGEGSGFTVLDVSDPSDPSPMGGISLGQGDVSDIVLAGTTAYAVNGNGLRTVDISDPDEPTLTGSVDLTGTMGALAITGSYAYVTGVVDWTDGWLYAVDVSDPEQPALLASYDTPGNAGDVAVVTDTVYVADGDDLLVLDVSDPNHPTELGTYTPPEPIRAVQAISTTAEGSAVYLLTREGQGHLRIVDVSDPTSPDPLGSYDALEGGNDLYVVDGTAYVADDDGVLRILDVSDTGNVQLLAAYDVGQAISGVVVSGAHAYVRGEHGIHVLDVSDTENPDALGSHERPSAVMDVIVDHPSGYIAGYDKLWTIDLTDPILPVPVGSAPLQGLVGEGRQLAIAPHPQSGVPLVYVAERFYGLEIFNVADPANPAAIGEVPIPGGHEMNDVYALGDYAYALTDDGGDGRLHVLDVSVPNDPDETDTYNAPGDARQVVVAELVTGTSTVGAQVDAVTQAAQTVAFVADGEAGLRMIDVSDPDDVTELNHIDPPAGAATDLVTVIDGWAYVGSNTGTTWHVQVFDVTDPFNPTLLGEQHDLGQVNDLDVDDDYIYVAVTDGGPAASARALWDPLWPANDDPEVEVGVHVYTGGRYWSTTGYESNYWGGYQTNDADSVHRYVANVMGYQVRFTFIDKATYGAEVTEVVGDEQPGDCGIDARIEPAKAEADGCTLSPLGFQACKCGSDEEIPFEHEAVNGWEWDGLNPDPVTCPEAGTRTVIGQFAPFVTLGGGAASSFLCMSDEPPPVEERTQTAFWFFLQASEADTWELTSLTFQASGDGDDAANVEEVRLYHGSTQIGTGTFSGDDGTVTLEFPTIIIATTPQNFRLDYVFDYEGFEACGAEAKQFDVTVSNLPSGLEPQNYKPGHYSGGASGSVTIGCVVHEDTKEGFDTIQEAVDGASEGTTISVCPGRYEENVDVETSVTIQSMEGLEETVVQAADANDHVFHVQQNLTTIKGFTIEGATGADRAGVYVHGSTVQDASILDSYMADNRYGIYLHEAQRAEIKRNYVSNNTASGMMLKSSTESQIENNSFYLNGEDGIYIEECQHAAGQETTITQNSVTRNERHGIHLKGSSGIDIENNISLSENEQHGVFVESSAGVSIADNPIIRENAEKGISLHNCQPDPGEAPNHILGNTIFGNRSQGKQSVGIHLDSSTGVMIGSPEKPNTIQSHASHGISLVNGADDNVIRGNTIQWNDTSGVSIEGSCGNQIGDGNTIGEDNRNGVRLADCLCGETDQNEITENTGISGNEDSGIWIESSCGVRISDNEHVKSNEHGITLSSIDCSADQQKVEVSQNTIKENEASGIHVLFEGSGVWVSNNEIAYQAQDGIYVQSSSGRSATEGPVFIGNIVEHNKVGVRLTASSDAWVGMWQEGTTVYAVRNTIAHNSEAGIKLESGSLSARAQAGSQKNHIGFNTLEENPVGIYVFKQSDSAEIRDNTIRTRAGHVWHGAMDFGGTGILVIDASGNNIHHNTTGPDVQEGITLWGASGNTIADNTVQDYDKNGVHLIHGSDNTLTGNTIQAPDATCVWMGSVDHCNGILLESSDANAIGKTTEQANQITGNADGRGICVIEGKGNRIANNTVGPDNKHGIFLSRSQENTIKNNRVRDNDKDGIHLHSSKGNTIEGNTAVDDNGGHGIYLKWSDGNHIRQNHVEDNGKNGIFLYECKENEDIANNEILENGESGIRLTSSHHNRMTENTITDNTKHGIRIKYGRNNEILGKHSIAGNGRYGIYAEGSPRTKVHGEQFQSSITGNTESGVYLKSSRESKVVRLQIEGNQIGVKIETTSDFNVARNYLKDNDDAFDVDGASEGNNYAFENVWEKNGEQSSQTSIHVRDSNLRIIGSTIVEDLGAGIIVEGDSDVSIRKSNIHGNAGFGLHNMNPGVTIDAQDNWWGDPSGPGGTGPGSGEEVTGTVDVSNWRSAPVNLVAVAFPETVLAARGMTGSNQVYLQDSVAPTETVTVTVSDARGWLLGPGSFTATVEASTIVSVNFTVPIEAAIGASDEATVAVASHTDPTAVDTTSFRVTTALMADLALSKESPESVIGQEIAYTIVVTNTGPDSASGVTITDTLPLTATVVSVATDQGSCTEQAGRVVCDVGTLASGAQARVDLIVRANDDEGLYTSAEVSASEHDPDPSDNFESAHTVVDVPAAAQVYLPLVVRRNELQPRVQRVRQRAPSHPRWGSAGGGVDHLPIVLRSS